MKKLRLIGRNLNLRLDFFALILTSIKLILVRQIQLFDFLDRCTLQTSCCIKFCVCVVNGYCCLLTLHTIHTYLFIIQGKLTISNLIRCIVYNFKFCDSNCFLLSLLGWLYISCKNTARVQNLNYILSFAYE